MILCISGDTFWAGVSAISTFGLLVGTILLVFYGRKQLRSLKETNEESSQTNKETFLHQLKEDFFTNEARELLLLTEYDLLTFDLVNLNENSEDKLGFFEAKNISNEKAKEVLKSIITNKKIYTSYEMDDFLLQHLEDIGFLFKKGIIDIDNIDQLFGYYIVVVFENVEIRKYMKWAKEVDDDIYSNFELVYNALKR